MAPKSGSGKRPSIARVVVAFVALFAVYQASEGLQTIFAPASSVGPVLMVLTLFLAGLFGRWLGWRGYDAYGLDFQSRSLAILVAGMLLAAMAFLASRSIGTAVGVFATTGGTVEASVGFLAFALVSTFVPSVAEDILTRGFLLKTLPVQLTAASYVVLSALLYTANHIWRFDWGISEQVRLFCLGLAYGAAAWRWRTLWGAVALHWGWNLSNALVGQVLPAESLSIDAARYLSAAANLAIFAVVVLLPSSAKMRENSAPEQEPQAAKAPIAS